MENYTKYMTDKMEEALYGDDPREILLEVVNTFRSFTESLDAFLVEHGRMEADCDQKSKIAFLNSAFERAGITPIPDIRKWYRKREKRIERETGFQICFALGFDLQETEQFFQKVVFEKCFDCHRMREAIYYFCFQHGMSYREAMAILEKAPIREAEEAAVKRIVFDGETLYTSTIIRELDQCQNEEELLRFLRRNAKKFGYNHVGATEMIQTLWHQIEKSDGLAAFEKEMVQGESLQERKKRSVFDILSQLLGMDEYEKIDVMYEGSDGERTEKHPLYVIKADRSFKPMLTKNPLLHLESAQNFPNRQAIEKMLDGKMDVKPDSIRKTLIFTYFCYYWLNALKKRVEKGEPYIYQSGPGDAERFRDQLNNRLVEVQYPTLYEGNPYDWIFMFCGLSEEPIQEFRDFIHEMYLENAEKIQEANEKAEQAKNPENP